MYVFVMECFVTRMMRYRKGFSDSHLDAKVFKKIIRVDRQFFVPETFQNMRSIGLEKTFVRVYAVMSFMGIGSGHLINLSTVVIQWLDP